MEASANGTTPDFAHLESLAEKRRLAQDHAHEADKAFMRRIRAKAADTNAMVDKSISALAADPWEPKPTIHDIHLNLADGLKSFEQGDYATAIEAFQKCVDLDPTYQDAYAGLGGSYASLGQHARAIEAFRKVLDINPNHPETHYNLGCIYQDLGRYEDALTSYRAAAAARPDYALAYCKIGALALGFDRYKESAEALERAIELDPNLPDGLYNLASAYLHLGDYERAFEVCSRLMQTNPEHSDAQQLLAAIQKKQGEVATSCSHGENVP
jgi:tetratricopeptide (TPR) repeat protein